ncbi:MAG: hypothetical protein KDN20_09320 [Verrucomicrobiae bacterium]|nr:hypothetical protein [Verrucomicrobiae bacterium]
MTKTPAHFVAILALLRLGAIRPAFSAIDFERDIRPIFAEKYTRCHGPDDEKRGLRLMGIDFATRPLDSGDVAIIPGKPDESTLIDRIQTSDPDDVMPPPASPWSMPRRAVR